MFCVNCGHSLPQGSRFCPGCGAEVQPPQSTSQPQTVSTPGPVYPAATPQAVYQQPAMSPPIWVFSATRKLGVFKAVSCSIVFMPDRLVLAHLTPELQKAESARLAQERKARGDGFFKSAAATFSHWSNFTEKYMSMSEPQILAEDLSNISVPYAAVTSVLFRCYSETTSYDNNYNSTSSGGRLEITLPGDTLKFTHKQRHSRDVKALLERLFGQRLKYKK